MKSPCALFCLVFLVFSQVSKAQDHRLPVPDRKEVLAERKSYEAGYELKAPEAQDRIAAMLSDSAAEKASPQRRWALLEDVMKLSLRTDEFDAGLKAAHRQADLFVVSRAKVVRDFVTDFSKSKRSAYWAARAAQALLETGSQVWVEGDKSDGKKLIGDAEKQVKKYKQAGLYRRIQAVEELLNDYSKLVLAVEKAGEEASAFDRALVHLIGSGDVASASLSLESSEDEKLKALGQAEARSPGEVPEILDVADMWWQAGESASTDLARSAFRARALNLAVSVIGRTNSEQQARLFDYLARPQYRAASKRLLLVGEDEKGAADDYALMQVDDYIQTEGISKTAVTWRVNLPKFPELQFTPGRRYLAVMKTSEGDMVLELHPEAAPRHVANFIYLSRLGFYEDLVVHRIIKGFMAQFGCPLGTGKGGPGYQFEGELETSLKHDRTGVVSMANSGPGTEGCQFFVTFTATPHLDGKHTAFGRMLTGRSTCDAIESKGSDQKDESGTPTGRVVLQSIHILVL